MKFVELFSKLKKKLIFLFNKNKRLFISVVALVVILVFYFIVSFSSKKKVSSKVSTDVAVESNSSSYDAFVENKICKMVLALPEVSRASVMVVCESSICYEYLKNVTESETQSDTSTTKNTTSEVVYEKNGSGSSPIIVSSKMPRVVGVWVILNAISPSTKLSIINSIATVLNIDTSCISILQER